MPLALRLTATAAAALTLLACIGSASAGAGGGTVVLPVDPDPQWYRLGDSDGTGCAGPYGCYADFVSMQFFRAEGKWMALVAYAPWNPLAVFGPLEGSPEEGFSYTSSGLANKPFWGCIGDVTVHLDIGALDESTLYDLYVERSGTTVATSLEPCYPYHLYGTGEGGPQIDSES